MATSLHYEDFREMKPGESGHWYKERKGKTRRVTYKDKPPKGRWYISPSTHEVIPLRQFQQRARGGVTYKEYVEIREKQGIPKRVNKPRQPTYHKPTKKEQKRKAERTKSFINKMLASREKSVERRDILQAAWAKARSDEYGMDLKFEELPDIDQTEFWHYYHEIVADTQPETYEEFQEEYGEYFILDQEDFGDIEYGQTP